MENIILTADNGPGFGEAIQVSLYHFLQFITISIYKDTDF